MKRVAWIAPLLAASALATQPAIAADNGVYLGASVGFSNVDIDEVDFSGDATGFKVIAGWRFLDWLAVEANYVDFGDAEDTIETEDVGVDVDGYTISAVGFLPVGPVDAFARVGAVSWDASLSAGGFGLGGVDGTDFTWGLGVQFRLGSFAVRAEYEQFEFDEVNSNLISAGFTWTFF